MISAHGEIGGHYQVEIEAAWNMKNLFLCQNKIPLTTGTFGYQYASGLVQFAGWLAGVAETPAERLSPNL